MNCSNWESFPRWQPCCPGWCPSVLSLLCPVLGISWSLTIYHIGALSCLQHSLWASWLVLSNHSAPNYSSQAFSLLQAIYLALVLFFCLNFQLPQNPSLSLRLISRLLFLCRLGSLWLSIYAISINTKGSNCVTILTFHSSHSVTLSKLWAELCPQKRYVEVLILSTSELDLIWK